MQHADFRVQIHLRLDSGEVHLIPGLIRGNQVTFSSGWRGYTLDTLEGSLDCDLFYNYIPNDTGTDVMIFSRECVLVPQYDIHSRTWYVSDSELTALILGDIVDDSDLGPGERIAEVTVCFVAGDGEPSRRPGYILYYADPCEPRTRLSIVLAGKLSPDDVTDLFTSTYHEGYIEIEANGRTEVVLMDELDDSFYVLERQRQRLFQLSTNRAGMI